MESDEKQSTNLPISLSLEITGRKDRTEKIKVFREFAKQFGGTVEVRPAEKGDGFVFMSVTFDEPQNEAKFANAFKRVLSRT